MMKTTEQANFSPLIEVLTVQDRQDRIPVTFFVPTFGKRIGTVVIGLNESPHTYSRRFGDEECPEAIMSDFWKLVDQGRTAAQINAEVHRRAGVLVARRKLRAA
ncbi:hypothetical protein [Streptomyces sp. NBC_01530]|uniref:hypothetical protein n=1 Tax=Streptomyces sp. NBC_01530 TaxID=2903895 RepID=UPI00386E1587